MTVSPSSEPQPLAGSLRKRPLGGLRRVLGSRLVSALAYPQTVDHYLSLVSPLWSIHQIRAEVAEVVRETSDVVTLVLRPNENFRGYKAGQYVAVTVEVDGAQHTRCFSLSSTPLRRDGLVTLTVKARAQGGLVSPHFLAKARPGMLLTLSAPQGDFVLPEQLPGKLLFISGGSGITPCMSMLRTLLSSYAQGRASTLGSGYTGEIVFVHYARSPADVIFAEELRDLAARHANLKLVVETESERGSVPDLNEQSLAAIVPDFQGWDTWVCGPRPLMDACKAAFSKRGAGERVRSEEFVAAQAHAAADGEAGDLLFARARKHVEGDSRTLLIQAEAAGLRPKSGCRMGICQTCICKKVSGVTKDIRSGALSTEENVEIKLCISVPMGDVTLDL